MVRQVSLAQADIKQLENFVDSSCDESDNDSDGMVSLSNINAWVNQ